MQHSTRFARRHAVVTVLAQQHGTQFRVLGAGVEKVPDGGVLVHPHQPAVQHNVDEGTEVDAAIVGEYPAAHLSNLVHEREVAVDAAALCRKQVDQPLAVQLFIGWDLEII